MSTINDGGPAFPVREAERFNPENSETHAIEQHWGMSLRDWLAGQALCGILSNQDLLSAAEDSIGGSAREAATTYAYAVADSALKSRGQ